MMEVLVTPRDNDERDRDNLRKWLCSFAGVDAGSGATAKNMHVMLRDASIRGTIIAKARTNAKLAAAVAAAKAKGEDPAEVEPEKETPSDKTLDEYMSALRDLGMKEESLLKAEDLEDSAQTTPEGRTRVNKHVIALRRMTNNHMRGSSGSKSHLLVRGSSFTPGMPMDGTFSAREKELLLWALTELAPMGKSLPLNSRKETINELKNGQALIVLGEILTGVSAGHYYHRSTQKFEREHNISLFTGLLAKRGVVLPESVTNEKLAEGDMDAMMDVLTLLRENFDLDHMFKQTLRKSMIIKPEDVEKEVKAAEAEKPKIEGTDSDDPVQEMKNGDALLVNQSKLYEEEEKKFVKSLRRLSLPYHVVVASDPVHEQKHEERKQWYMKHQYLSHASLPEVDEVSDQSTEPSPGVDDVEQGSLFPRNKSEADFGSGMKKRPVVPPLTIQAPKVPVGEMSSPSSLSSSSSPTLLFSPTLKPALPRPLQNAFVLGAESGSQESSGDDDEQLLGDAAGVKKKKKKSKAKSSSKSMSEGSEDGDKERSDSFDKASDPEQSSEKQQDGEKKPQTHRKKKKKKSKKEGSQESLLPGSEEPSSHEEHVHRKGHHHHQDEDKGTKSVNLLVVSPPPRGPMSPTGEVVAVRTRHGSSAKKTKKHASSEPNSPAEPAESQLSIDARGACSAGSPVSDRPMSMAENPVLKKTTITIDQAIMAASGSYEIKSSTSALVPLNGKRYESWPSLGMVLEDPILKASFFSFLQDEFALENVLFYEDVLRFRALYAANPSSRAVMKEAVRIYKEYFTESSPNEINVSWDTKRAVASIFEPPSGQPPETVPATVWDLAWTEMMSLLYTDLFVRWYNGMQPPTKSTFEAQLKEKKRAKLGKQIGFSQAAMSFFGVKETVRVKAVERLRDSEKAYVEALTSCVDELLVPLSTSKIITEEDVWNVFGPLKVLQIYHNNLYSRLQATVGAWQDHISTIGDVFNDNTEFLPLYSCYIRNYAYSVLYYRQLRVTKPQFAKFAEAYDRKHRGDYTLQDVLALPCDRLETYATLISTIQKYTSKSHIDSSLLEKCYERVYHLSTRISFLPDANTIVENRKLIAVADSIQGMEGQCLIVPGRRVVYHGIVTITRVDQSGQSSTPQGTPVDCMLILFNDLLVCCDITANDISKRATAPVLAETLSSSGGSSGSRQRRTQSGVRPVESLSVTQFIGVPSSLSVASSMYVKTIDRINTDTDRLGRPRIQISSNSGELWAFFASVNEDETYEWEDYLAQVQRDIHQ